MTGTLYAAQAGRLQVLLSKTGVTLRIEHPVAASISSKSKPLASAGGAEMSQHGDAAQFTVEEQHLQFVNSNPNVTIEPLDEQAAKVNYFLGSDPSHWLRNLNSYARVRYHNLYPGIDLIFYSRNGKLEYDFAIAAGADPSQIRLRIDGSDTVQVSKQGDLEIGSGDDAILHRPILYQNLKHGKKLVQGRFIQLADDTLGFQFDHYDKSKTFIIDPAINLVYSTYAGGKHNDIGFGVAEDAGGNTYITGESASQDFPVSGNAYQTARTAIGTYTYNAVVMKFDPSGTLLYSTFLAGSTGPNNIGNAIVVDASGNAIVGGQTNSTDFPVTPGAFQTTNGGGNDAFLAKISPDGSQLLYSTYLGGSGDEYIGSMLLNSDGSLWLAGGASAAGLPASASAFQKKPNGLDNFFIAKAVFNQSGVLTLPYLTFLGGSNQTEEAAWGSLATDSAGNVYLAGGTNSSDFPASANALEKSIPLSGGCFNSATPNSAPFVSKFSPDLSQLLYSSEIGGKTEDQQGYPDCNNVALSIHLDAQGNIWTIGTVGDSDLPVTANAISKQLNGNGGAGVDYYVSELSADGSKLLYCTYLGGSQFDYGARAVWDSSGNIWIHGNTQSTDYPVTSDALQSANAGGYDATVTELSPDGTKILYSTYLGGSGDDDVDGTGAIAIDAAGNLHLTGETASANFPLTPSAFQSVYANGDAGADGADVYYTELGTGTIGTVGPLVGGNTGDTSLTIDGAGFQQGSTCSLVQGGATIASTQATVNSSGTSITCSFGLNGAQTGSYDVTVNNPDGSSFTKKGGFTVQSGGQQNVWADVINRPAIRVSTPSLVTVTYGNSGSEDALYTTLYVNFSGTLQVTIPGGIKDPDNPNTTISDQTALITNPDGTKTLSVIIPVIPAGSSSSIQFQIEDSTLNDNYTIETYLDPPFYSSRSEAKTALTNILNANVSIGSTCPSGGNNCPAYWADFYAQGILPTLQTLSQADSFTYDQSQAYTYFQMSYVYDLYQYLSAPLSLGSSNFRLSDNSLRNNFLSFKPSPHIILGPNGQPIEFPVEPTPPVGEPPPPPVEVPATGSAAEVGAAEVGGAVELTGGAAFAAAAAIAFGAIALQYDVDQAMNLANAVKNGGDLCSYPFGKGHTVLPSPTTTLGPCDGNQQLLTVTFHCSNGDEPYQSYVKCQNPPPPCKAPAKCGKGGAGGAVDPNYKVGPTGDSSQSQYVNMTVPLQYGVGFENEPTATLPAANVVVTDQLDPTRVDLSTLTLGTISFGNNVINLPSGTNNYNTTYNINSSLSVRIQGSLNTTTGLLKWTFTSIDPSTGLPPTDPTVGFLPPDTDGIVGQASVLFNVMPKSGQSTGASIANTATVVFDTNAPINTDTWTNTLDVDAPSSAVAALPALEIAPSGSIAFTVNWSGTDKGSGISTYSVYVSDNGGAFTAWQSNVVATSASFTGTAGHTYGFYSIATDGAGNVEAVKTKADTTTQVVTSAPPDFTLGATASSLSIAPGGSGAVTINVTPVNGFNQAVSFACSGLPSESSCNFSPTTVTPNGTAATGTTLTITTTAPSNRQTPQNIARLGGGSLAIGLLLLPFFYKKRRLGAILVLLCALSMLGMIACSGTSSSNVNAEPPANPGTPAGTSTVTVTATSGGGTPVSHTTTISLTIQ